MREMAGRSHFVWAGCFALIAFVAIGDLSLKTAVTSSAQSTFTLPPINTPIGIAKGTNPGRVVWAYDPAATNPNCTDVNPDLYYLDNNTNEAVVEQMFTKSILQLTGTSSVAAAWAEIFKYYNTTKRNLSNTSYTAGEKIFIKINLCGSFGMNDSTKGYNKGLYTQMGANSDYSGMPDVSPQLIRVILRQLTATVGVNQQNIYIGDPSGKWYNQIYNMVQPQFPNVHYVDLWGLSGSGRERVVPTSNPAIFYADHYPGRKLADGTWDLEPATSDSLPQQIVDATYLIDAAVLKAHESAGITLCAKNFFGATCRRTIKDPHNYSAMAFHHSHPESWNSPGYNKYRNLVDFMGHKDLGGKIILGIVDGLWGGHMSIPQHADKWKSAPFNNNWPSSILMSQDMVAIEAVGFDFLRNEYSASNGYASDYQNPNNLNGVDDYLFQAASSVYWPTTDALGNNFLGYAPSGDGKVIGSLGVYERWNNATDKNYTKNLNPSATNGIELVKILPPVLVKETVSSATASSSESASYPASAAIDGNTTTRWSSLFTDQQWIAFDMGSAKSITTVVLDWETANASAYTIQGSNDNFATSTTIVTKSNMPAFGNHRIDSISGLTGTYRYYRMNGTTRTTAYGYSIWEARLYSVGSAPMSYTITPTAGANGSVSPSSSVSVASGASQTFTFTPSSGYVVDAVTVDGASVGSVPSYTFTNVTTNHTISVTFKQSTVIYTLTASANPSAGGTVTGGGSYNSGAAATVTATPASGFTFTGWSGDLTGATNPSTITMNGNKSVTANFASQNGQLVLQTVSLATASSAESALYPASAAIDNNIGTRWSSAFSDSQWITFDLGSSKPIVAAVLDWETANASAYVIMGSNDNFATSATIVTKSNMPAFGNHRIDSISGLAGTYRYYRMSGKARSTAYGYSIWEARFYTNGTPVTYTLTTTTNPTTGGTVSGGGTYAMGTTATLTATPAPGYSFASWSGDVTSTTNPITVTMTANKNVTANFTLIPTYTISAPAGSNGAITPSGTVTVTQGNSQTFTMTPSSGYAVDVVTVDGVSQGAIASYTFTNVTTNHTITVTFKQSTVTYSLTTIASPIAGGTITGGGNYASGAIATVTATSASGYTFANWSGAATGTTNPIVVTMDANKTVTANFIATVPFIQLPGRIEAENYKAGGEGVGYHDLTAGNTGGAYKPNDNVDIEATTDVGGGYNVGWIDAGEWLAYDVNVAQTGLYTLTARMASANSGTKTLTMTVDNVTVATFNLTDASGWQSWQNIVMSNVNLTSGIHSVRFAMTTGGFNLNYVDVSVSTANLLTNGDFSNGLTGWQTLLLDGATATFSNDVGSAKIAPATLGPNPWDIQIYQDISVIANKTYTLDFDIKASSTPKDFKVVVEHDGDPFTKYVEVQKTIVNAANTMQHFTIQFTPNASDSPVKIGFHFGTFNTSSVWIDNVTLK